jgi:hypothetical protein
VAELCCEVTIGYNPTADRLLAPPPSAVAWESGGFDQTWSNLVPGGEVIDAPPFMFP